MKILEIRDYVVGMGHDKPTCRDAVRQFLRTNGKRYQIMLTLTLKQQWFDKNGMMKVKHYLSEKDIPKIYERFEHKLNRLVWGSRYIRFNNASLCLIKAWEDGYGTKRKHLHMLIGDFPQKYRFNEFRAQVEEATYQCYEIDQKYDAQLCDTDAIDYITKEIGKKDTDKIIWN